MLPLAAEHDEYTGLVAHTPQDEASGAPAPQQSFKLPKQATALRPARLQQRSHLPYAGSGGASVATTTKA